MIVALALALQEPPPTPLPSQMEPAVEAYSRCLFGETNRQMAVLMQKPAMGPKIFEDAWAACKEIRTQSIASSDAALMTLSGFADAQQRRRFIAERFDGLDQLMRETFSGGMDPDKWKQ